jgi:dihydropteroate synthase
MVAATADRTDAKRGDRWVVDARRGIVVARPAALMGILNATPDSFSDGGLHAAPAAGIAAGLEMVRDGAAWLDVGGESTRPGAGVVAAADESARVLPVIAGLRAAGITVPISIDTTKAVVADAALEAGASVINDVSAGSDPAMFPLAAGRGCAVVLMHMAGTPRTMQVAPRYDDVVDEVLAFLAQRMRAAVVAGVAETALLLDPGIGFGKTVEHNLALLRALPRFHAELGRPLVIGISRKSFLAKLTGVPRPAAQRDADSHVAHALLAPHAALLRVHDVPGARAALALAGSLWDGGGAHAP